MDNSRSEVVFTFDGDAAGQKAALRAFEDDQKFAARTSIAVTPDGMDPCELRLAKGDAAVEQVIEGRTPLFEFAIRSVVEQHDALSPEGQSAALEATAPIVARIKDQAIRHKYAVMLAGLPVIVGMQLLLSFLAFDIAAMPNRALHPLLTPRLRARSTAGPKAEPELRVVDAA